MSNRTLSIYNQFLKPFQRIVLIVLFAFNLSSVTVIAQQIHSIKNDTLFYTQKDLKKELDLPLVFFTHRGMPIEVYTYSLKISALPTFTKESIESIYNLRFETGLTSKIGLLVGADRLFQEPVLQIMIQFLVLKSKDGKSGISPMVEFEIPFGNNPEKSISALIGFASTLSDSKIKFNQSVQYNPLKNVAEGSNALIYEFTDQYFLVSEVTGIVQKNIQPIFSLLVGIKIRLNDNFIFGFAYQFPVSTNKEYPPRFAGQTNVILRRQSQ